MLYLSIALGLSIGNFIYQLITDRNWNIALERSWFQLTAVLTVWLVISVGGQK